MGPLLVATEEQVKNWMKEVLLECQSELSTTAPKVEVQEKRYEYGIAGLARILNCSIVTAQKIKNSGKIPYQQVGRKVIFDVEKVLAAVQKVK